MVHIKMTKDRSKCGIKSHEVGEKTKYIGEDKKIHTAKFVREIILRDDDNNIIGVTSLWQ